MKKTIRLAILSSFAVPIVIYAWAGTLTEPSIGVGDGASNESAGALLDLLRNECGFVKGEFLNAWQGMDFSGPARIIPKLLKHMKAAGIDAELGVARLSDTNVTFRIDQSGWSADRRTRVFVNLDHPHPDRAALGKQLGLDLGAPPTTTTSETNREAQVTEPRVRAAAEHESHR